MQPDEVNVVLLLDLAIENPIDASVVLTQMPPDRADAATVLRVTDFGATRSNRGTPQHWRPVIAAIDRMVSQARAAERGGARCRYWVAGRAGLPAFFHLGHRLTRQAVVTLVNPRNSGPSDVLWLDRASAGPATLPYFVRSSPATQPSLAEVRVSLVVSAMKPIARAQIEAQMSERGTVSPVVEAQATGFLDETSIAAALRELDDTAAGIRAAYPACGALAVFIAGPATLAVLVGRSLNPNIYPDIQVFHQHASARYELAYETQPARLATKNHTILFLASNPARTNQIALDQEARAIQEEIDRRGDRCRLIFSPRFAAQPLDLLRLLRELKPAVVHFSGHGSKDGLFFQAADGLPRIVSGDAIAMAFGATEAPAQLVVFNACYSQSQTAELQAHVPCMIGMSAKIDDGAAQRFAIGLYGGLAHGDSIATAYNQGCAAIALDGFTDHDKPQLIVRDGVDANAITLA
jgi:hypothetical protein